MAASGRLLHGASSGASVRIVQEALAERGYALGRIDGVYGPRTEAAVRQFQRDHGVGVDGIVGRRTLDALRRGTKNPELGRVRVPLHVASVGPEVRAVQARLAEFGYALEPDGVFGPETERALREFQRARGLEADGLVGPDTTAALGAADAPDATTSAEEADPRLTEGAALLLAAAAELHPPGEPWALYVVRAAIESSEFGSAREVRVVMRLRDEARGLFAEAARPTPRARASNVPLWIVEEADDIRRYVEPREGRIDVRHVLAAAVAGRGARYVDAALRRAEKPLDLLRRALHEAVVEQDPDGPASRWARVLRLDSAEAPAVLGGGFSTDYVPAEPEEPLPDLLGVSVYVRMLALLIADTDTRMPLSIGLFGEWGSGKSHFMALLRQAVKELASGASEGDAGAFRQDVVQITFNAWHYSDTNLWASLAAEIFEQLAGPAPSAPDDDRRRQLRDDLGKAMQHRKELEERRERATAEVAELQKLVLAAEVDRDAQRAGVLRQLLDEAAVKKPLHEAAAALGLRDEECKRFRDLAAEATGAGREAASTWRYFTRRRWSVAAAGLVVLFLALVTLTPTVGGSVRRWVGAGSTGSLLAAAGAAAEGLRRTRSGLAKLREAAAAADRVLAGQPTREQAALAAAQARLDTLSAQLDEVVAQVGTLGRELAELTAGHRLYRFIAERAASDDYRRHLGIVSAIRHDFEHLVELMAQWRTERSAPVPGAEPPPKPIDRIVLYIDDLDRCSAEQVVEVLQAVHLLLAMDLFVVVVGVDPRWLLRSLHRTYAGILDTDGDRDTWSSTPHDYLEKIFNIPFAIPRMSAASYRGLLDGIAAARDDRPEPDTALPVPDDQVEPGEVPLVAQAESAVATAFEDDVPPVIKPMTRAEVDYLARLASMMRSPRAATRMLNVYRMLRSTKNLSVGGTFLDSDDTGEYRVVAQLLAVLTGYPALLGPMLFAPATEHVPGGLVRRPPGSSWRTFVEGLTVTEGSNDVMRGISPADAVAWNHIAEELASWAGTIDGDDVLPFQEWAPHVARFSFHPSPYAGTG